MAKTKPVHLRFKDRTAIDQREVVAIRKVLTDLGFEIGTVGDYDPPGSDGVTECGTHSCVGFDPGGDTDCSPHGSRCDAEACDTQACSGHACESNSCSTETCGGHVCDIHEPEKGQVYASMAKSKAFAALQSALAKVPTGIGGGVSLSIR